MKIVLDGVSKRFKNVEALRQISLTIEDGELFTLLGPSGCGKTTTLRIIAGFYGPDTGAVCFGGKVVNDLPTSKRNIGIVFQNFALWPHMSVARNISYGLQFRGIPKSQAHDRVEQVLHKVGLQGLGSRYPGQLSGGQQQRVALARALVLNPDVLLLDEPLSNLDAKVRVRVRGEIRKLQQELGTTTVYVTHDQEEALTLSDRIAIMNDGLIVQIGNPRELYECPASRFVADFIGTNNLISATITGRVNGSEYRANCELGSVIGTSLVELSAGSRCTVSIRPENMIVAGDSSELRTDNKVAGRVSFASYMGNALRYEIEVEGGQMLKADIKDPRHHDTIPLGTLVWAGFNKSGTLLIPDN